jgi:predicted RND superfamily exporter protein
MKEKLIDFLVKNRVASFIAVTVIILLMGGSIKNIHVSGKIEGFFVKNNPYTASINKVVNFYPFKYIVQLQVSPKNSNLQEVISGLEILNSLLSSQFPSSKMHSLDNAKLFLNLHFSSDSSIFRVMSEVKKIPLLQQLVSDNEKHLLMLLYLKDSGDFRLSDFNKIIDRSYPGIERIIAISQFHIEDQIEKSIREDLLIISLIIVLLISFLILLIYRDIYALLLVGVNAIYPLIALFFFFSLMKIEINMITVIAVPLILILSLADSIHIMTGFSPVALGGENISNIIQTLKRYIVPCFFTSATDSVAFLSFVFNDSINIREFGIISGILAMLEYTITILTVPFLLSLLKKKRAYNNTLDYISDKLISKKRTGSLILIGMMIISFFFLPLLKFNTDYDSFFPLNTQLRENHREMGNNFQSIIGMDIIIEKKNDSLSDLGIDQFTINLVDTLLGLDGVKRINSLKDEQDFKMRYLKGFPFLKLDKSDNVFKLPGKSRIHVSVNTPDDIQMIKNRFEQIVKEYSGAYEFTYFSPALLFDFINISVAKSLIMSLLSSAISIFFMFWFLFKNLRVALASMIANIVPIGGLILIFVAFNISINIGTALTSVICIGIIVDDTIHILYRKLTLKEELNELNHGLFITWLILTVGFLTFIQSSFQPTRIFGLLSSSVFVIGYLSDLLIINWFLDIHKKPKDKKNYEQVHSG